MTPGRYDWLDEEDPFDDNDPPGRFDYDDDITLEESLGPDDVEED